MILRISISSAKKFFQKNLECLKSYISGGYQRLPKSSSPPPFKPLFASSKSMDLDVNLCPSSYAVELDLFYTDFTHHWDLNEQQQLKKNKNKNKKMKNMNHKENNGSKNETTSSSPAPQLSQREAKVDEEDLKKKVRRRMTTTAGPTQNDQVETRAEQKRKQIVNEGKGIMKNKISGGIDPRKKEHNNGHLVVAQKKLIIKELEMVDKGNVEHVLDIEEVLHYYSRLTCPAYLQIVDKFFMDIYEDFFTSSSA